MYLIVYVFVCVCVARCSATRLRSSATPYNQSRDTKSKWLVNSWDQHSTLLHCSVRPLFCLSVSVSCICSRCVRVSLLFLCSSVCPQRDIHIFRYTCSCYNSRRYRVTNIYAERRDDHHLRRHRTVLSLVRTPFADTLEKQLCCYARRLLLIYHNLKTNNTCTTLALFSFFVCFLCWMNRCFFLCLPSRRSISSGTIRFRTFGTHHCRFV